MQPQMDADERGLGGAMEASGAYVRDASRRLAFEVARMPTDSYRRTCEAIAAAFALSADGEVVTNATPNRRATGAAQARAGGAG